MRCNFCYLCIYSTEPLDRRRGGERVGSDTQIVSIANIRQEARPDVDYTRPNTTVVGNDRGVLSFANDHGSEDGRISRGPPSGGYGPRPSGTNGDAGYSGRRENSHRTEERQQRYESGMPLGMYGGHRHSYSGDQLNADNMSSDQRHRRVSAGTNDHRPERLMRGGVLGGQGDGSYYENESQKPRIGDEYDDYNYEQTLRRHHLDPSSAAASSRNTRSNRRKLESMLRNDSLSSDPSDCVVRPPPPKPYKHRRGRNKHRRASFSSSDDEMQTTPDCTSGDEPELESESVSEKGKKIICCSMCILILSR